MQTKIASLRYHDVVQKALEFMRGRPPGRTAVAEVAACVSYSPAHLRRIFKAVTGRGVLLNLCDVRIAMAKNLLNRTTMTVSEVAYAAGFENPSNFTRLFRRNVGTTPTVFREAMPGIDETQTSQSPAPRAKMTNLMVRDDFTAPVPAEWWTPTAGVWEQREGRLRGSGPADLTLRLATALPENFRMDFDIRIMQAHYLRCRLHLLGAEGSEPYCEIALHHPANSPGVLRRANRNVLWSPEAVLKPGVWHAVRMEMNDNRIAVFLDGKPVFGFRDIFPPPYSRRCRFALACYENMIDIRQFRLFDLEFLPVVSAIRQGDALYNSGLFVQAREFYLRHLRANMPAEEEMELRFKIGMCLFHQHQPEPCREWMHSIMPLAKAPFWRRESDLVLLRLDADSGDIERFMRHATASSRDPSLLDGIRPILADYLSRMQAAGFYDRALQLAKLSLALEKGGADMVARARDKVANILKHMQRFPEAARHLRLLARRAPTEFARTDALISLCEINLMQHNVAGARRIIARFPKPAERREASALRDFHEALCLRTERRFKEAIKLFLAIPTRHAGSISWRHIPEMCAADLLCCLGERKEAHRLVERARREYQKPLFQKDDPFRDYAILSHLKEERYEELSVLLLADARGHDDRLSARGLKAVTAGIMLELAGKKSEAKQVWAETAKRFPSDRCYFWRPFAQALADGKPDNLETAQLSFRVRSQIFLLAGLLFEHRGQADRAQRLFALSVENDPTLNWAAHLASIKQTP